ncbi:MAG TPA: hypothetical protein VFE15_03820 [Marmoricola sp.]|jgi:hypothetical protein|nr:hypothetical protein [Marmoricola sp.]
MNPTKMLLGIAPWIAFSIIADRLGADRVGLAAAIACLGSLVLALRGAREDGVKIIDAAGVVTFAALGVAGALASHTARVDLVDFGRGGSAVVLATVMLVSAFTVPFTEQYARAQVDRRYWGSPVFRSTNRRISLVWAGSLFVMAAGHLVQGALAHSGSSFSGNLLLNFALPVVLCLGAVKMTQRIADEGSAPVAVGGVA